MKYEKNRGRSFRITFHWRSDVNALVWMYGVLAVAANTSLSAVVREEEAVHWAASCASLLRQYRYYQQRYSHSH